MCQVPSIAMFNLANLFCLIVLLCGPFCGFAAARDCHPGVVNLVLFSLGSLLSSILVSFRFITPRIPFCTPNDLALVLASFFTRWFVYPASL